MKKERNINMHTDFIDIKQISRLLDGKYIDKNSIDIGAFGDVYINIDVDRLKKDNDIADDSMLYYIDDCAVTFYSEISEIVLTVERMAISREYDLKWIIDSMEICAETAVDDYITLKNIYENFKESVIDVIKSKIRKEVKIPKGKYVSDKLSGDTYFQLRNYQNNNISFVINQWWRRFNKQIEFVNIGDDKTIFIAND